MTQDKARPQSKDKAVPPPRLADPKNPQTQKGATKTK